MAHFKTPFDSADAKRRFEVKRKQYEKLIHDAAKGDLDSEDERKVAEKRWRIRNEMGDLARFMSDEHDERDRINDKISALNRRYEEAREKGHQARSAHRDAEDKRLRLESHRSSYERDYGSRDPYTRGRY